MFLLGAVIASAARFATSGRALRLSGYYLGATYFNEITPRMADIVANGLTVEYSARLTGPVPGPMAVLGFATPRTPDITYNGGQWYCPYFSGTPYFFDYQLPLTVVRNQSYFDAAWHRHTHVLSADAVYTHYVDGAVVFRSSDWSIPVSDLRQWAFDNVGAPRRLSLTLGGSQSAFPHIGMIDTTDVVLDTLRIFAASLNATTMATSAAFSSSSELAATPLGASLLAAWDFEAVVGGGLPATVGTTMLVPADLATVEAASGFAPLTPDPLRCDTLAKLVPSGAGGTAATATFVSRLAPGATATASISLPAVTARGSGAGGGLAVANVSRAGLSAAVAADGLSVTFAAPGAAAGDEVVLQASNGGTLRVAVAAAGSPPVVRNVTFVVQGTAAASAAAGSVLVMFDVWDADGDAAVVSLVPPLPAASRLVVRPPSYDSENIVGIPPQPLRPRAALLLPPGGYGAEYAQFAFSARDETGMVAAAPAWASVRVARYNSPTSSSSFAVSVPEDAVGGVELAIAANVADPDAADFLVVALTALPSAAAGSLLRTPLAPAARKPTAADALPWRAGVLPLPPPPPTDPTSQVIDGVVFVKVGDVRHTTTVVAQWAGDVPDASFEPEVWSGPPAGVPPSSKEVVAGPPDCSAFGNILGCWYPHGPAVCSFQPQVIDRLDRGGDFLHVRVATPVAATAVHVKEAQTLGAVVALWAWQGAGVPGNASAGKWRAMWRRDWAPPSHEYGDVWAAPLPQCGVPLLATDFLVELDYCGPIGWSGIDAVRVFGQPAAPAAVAAVEGTRWRFVPAKDFNGQATATFYATDCLYDQTRIGDSFTVNITVTPVPDAPVATVPASGLAQEGGAVFIPVLASDVDTPATATPGPATLAAGYQGTVVAAAARGVAGWDTQRGGVLYTVNAADCGGADFTDSVSVAVQTVGEGLPSAPVVVAVRGCIKLAPAGLAVGTIVASVVTPVVVCALLAVGAFLLWRWRHAESEVLVETRPPPTGQIAMAFTDVQDSTVLWELFGHDFQTALAMHDATMREQAIRFNGYEVKTEGDAFFVAFDCVHDAVGWCLGAQQALLLAPWPTELLLELSQRGLHPSDAWRGPRVRMGVHVGLPVMERNPVTRRMDYFGPAVNTAARVQALGFGGQVLLSDAAREALSAAPCAGGPRCSAEAQAAAGLVLVCHGPQMLKGISEPVVVHAVSTGALVERAFPPLSTRVGLAVAAADKLAVGRPARAKAATRRVAPGGRRRSLASNNLSPSESALSDGDEHRPHSAGRDAVRSVDPIRSGVMEPVPAVASGPSSPLQSMSA